MVIYGSLGLDKLSQESCCSVYWTACQTKTLSLLTLLLYNIQFLSKILSNLCFYSIFHFVDITHSCILLYPCTLPVRLVLAKHEDGQSEQ